LAFSRNFPGEEESHGSGLIDGFWYRHARIEIKTISNFLFEIFKDLPTRFLGNHLLFNQFAILGSRLYLFEKKAHLASQIWE
jgi:hypothetical protein